MNVTPPPRGLASAWEWSGLIGMVTAATSAIFFLLAVSSWFQTLEDSFVVTGQVLDAADKTIEVVDEALVVLSETLGGVDGVFAQTEATLTDVSTVVLSTGTLLKDEIPAQVEAIQDAMDGLIGTANVVDGILSALSFVGVDYDPEVPLDDALIAVNVQLGELSTSFDGDAAKLFSLAVSINRLNEEVVEVGGAIAELDTQIAASSALITEYQEAAADAREVIKAAQERLDGQIWPVRILGLALLSALAVGFSLVWWVGRAQRRQT